MRKSTKQVVDKNFCYEEMRIYQDIIDVMEIDVNKKRGFILEYNGCPLMINGKILVKLCNQTLNYDKDKYVAFRPLINARMCNMILEYIRENDYEQAELITTIDVEHPDPEDPTKVRKYYSSFLKNEGEIIEEEHNCSTETESKFRTMYKYLLGDIDLDRRVYMIRKFNKDYEKAHPTKGIKKRKK